MNQPEGPEIQGKILYKQVCYHVDKYLPSCTKTNQYYKIPYYYETIDLNTMKINTLFFKILFFIINTIELLKIIINGIIIINGYILEKSTVISIELVLIFKKRVLDHKYI